MWRIIVTLWVCGGEQVGQEGGTEVGVLLMDKEMPKYRDEKIGREAERMLRRGVLMLGLSINSRVRPFYYARPPANKTPLSVR